MVAFTTKKTDHGKYKDPPEEEAPPREEKVAAQLGHKRMAYQFKRKETDLYGVKQRETNRFTEKK